MNMSTMCKLLHRVCICLVLTCAAYFNINFSIKILRTIREYVTLYNVLWLWYDITFGVVDAWFGWCNLLLLFLPAHCHHSTKFFPGLSVVFSCNYYHFPLLLLLFSLHQLYMSTLPSFIINLMFSNKTSTQILIHVLLFCIM